MSEGINEEKVIDRVMMIDQWKVSGDVYTQDELNAIGSLLDLYQKEKERNKDIANDLEKYKMECYLQGRKDEGKSMLGVVQRHYISKDNIREKMEEVKNLSTAGYEILKELLEGNNENIN